MTLAHTDIVNRLRATALDKDKCPRMDSERWFPVGLAKEAADEIERLQMALDAAVQDVTDAAAIYEAEITRLRGESEGFRQNWIAAEAAPKSPDNAVLDRVADEIIAGLRRENDNPFSGLALDPIEAIELLRRRVKSQSSGQPQKGQR